MSTEDDAEPNGVGLLRSFADEIVALFGFIVESDFAFLLGWDHFGKFKPEESASFSRSMGQRTEVPFGPATLVHQYRATHAEYVAHFRSGGRNQQLRNRAVVVFLFELWEHGYREKIASAAECGAPIESDVFGDIRRYRNSIAHNGGVFRDEPKILPFVTKGQPINLFGLEMDALFRIVLEELNRLGREHFDRDPNLTLDQVQWQVVLHQGPGFGRSRHPDHGEEDH